MTTSRRKTRKDSHKSRSRKPKPKRRPDKKEQVRSNFSKQNDLHARKKIERNTAESIQQSLERLRRTNLHVKEFDRKCRDSWDTRDLKRYADILCSLLPDEKHEIAETTILADPAPVETACFICGSGEVPETLLLCDSEGCHGEYHMGCLDPPLAAVPEGQWFCPRCEGDSNWNRRSLRKKTSNSDSASPADVDTQVDIGLIEDTSVNSSIGDEKLNALVEKKSFSVSLTINRETVNTQNQFLDREAGRVKPFTFLRFLRRMRHSDTAEALVDEDLTFACMVCRRGGDLISCDGCHYLVHEECMPVGLSKLLFDERCDRWFCESCCGTVLEKGVTTGSKRSRVKCVECDKTGGKLDSCHHCGSRFHFACMRHGSTKEKLCSTCRFEREKMLAFQAQEKKRKTVDDEVEDEDEDEEEEDEEEDEAFEVNHDEDKAGEEADDDAEEEEEEEEDFVTMQPQKPRLLPASALEIGPPPQRFILSSFNCSKELTPVFFRFVLENKDKIAQSLVKRRARFAKLEDGYDRDLIIVKEAARRWAKRSGKDIERWKEEMDESFKESVDEWIVNRQSELSKKRKKKSVQQAASKKKSKKSQTAPKSKSTSRLEVIDNSIPEDPNELFSEIVQDSRFHPLPVFSVEKGEDEYGILSRIKESHSKFFVKGPISTFVGDQCIGCARGWTHFCPILNKIIPCSENRAKFQPGLSTLVATRIGVMDRSSLDKSTNAMPFMNERFDDASTFIVDTAALKDVEWRQNRSVFKCLCGSSTTAFGGCMVCQRDALVKHFSKQQLTDYLNFLSFTIPNAPGSCLEDIKPELSNLCEKMKRSDWSANFPPPFEKLSYPGLTTSKGNQDEDNGHSNIKHELRFKRAVDRSDKNKSFGHEIEDERTALNLWVNEINQKCKYICICSVFLAVAKRDAQRTFSSFPFKSSDDENASGLASIKGKIVKESYTAFGTFCLDIKTLCQSALTFFAENSFPWRTARQMLSALEKAIKRANIWLTDIKCALSNYQMSLSTGKQMSDDPFDELRTRKPKAVTFLGQRSSLMEEVKAVVLRTKENEASYYGGICLKRAITASYSSLDLQDDTEYGCVVRGAAKNYDLQKRIMNQVAKVNRSSVLQDRTTIYERSLMALLKSVQMRRVYDESRSLYGAARCDGTRLKEGVELAFQEREFKVRKNREQNVVDLTSSYRVHKSRALSSTSIACQSLRNGIPVDCEAHIVKPSPIHGYGLFVTRPFRLGDVVVEYFGEYMSLESAARRAERYERLRRKNFQLRVGTDLVIDATMKGGKARFANHSCVPNCEVRVVDEPVVVGGVVQKFRKRVVLVAKRSISIGEEITFDYQLPSTTNLKERIPCKCCQFTCRGFMNYEQQPEFTNNARAPIHIDVKEP